jgi:predicted RNase H-like nuclease (RuvC/YqgF family)
MIQSADDLFRQLQSIHDRTRNEFQRLSAELSRVDRAISEIYHEIERTRFDAASGYRFAKKIQDLLIERRSIKDELTKIRSVYYALKEGFEKAKKAR